MATSLQSALDKLLAAKDDTLDRFVRARRLEQPEVSWRTISTDLYDTIGIDVPAETLRSWFPQYRDVAAPGGPSDDDTESYWRANPDEVEAS